ncbi:hypothetical protein [Streptomyces sp. NPDC001315]|uniref:hypothetical protein n=1 Tax=Streptomyces sp. NPDC001315 TaxID=3364562 RepID=UPI003698A7B1
MTISACSSGSNRPSEADGKKIANETRRSVAETYWQLYSSIDDAAFTTGADGSFARCEKNDQKLVRYTVRTILDSRDSKGSKETEEQLTSAVAARFSRVGWHLSQGLHRSATKGGIKAELLPPEFSGDTATVAFEVQSKCVDVGSITDRLVDSYGPKTDVYESSKKDAAPIPTTFPKPGV